MRRLLFMAAALLLGCNASLAQVSTMGTTAMGLSSTPGAIVTSPLSGPSPFSVTTQPGAPVTTLAPVPLASDPTTPGTVVTCSTPTGQFTPGIGRLRIGYPSFPMYSRYRRHLGSFLTMPQSFSRLSSEEQFDRQLAGAIAAGRIQSALAAQARVQSLPANTCPTA